MFVCLLYAIRVFTINCIRIYFEVNCKGACDGKSRMDKAIW